MTDKEDIIPKIEGDIIFRVPNYDGNVLEIKKNGDFIVKGKKVVNDVEVYEGIKEFIERAKRYDIEQFGNESGMGPF